MASGFIVFDGIGPKLDLLALGAYTETLGDMEAAALEVEYYAQANAPWADITGQARSGLMASVYDEGGEIVLELSHGVEYGYWLEVIQDGRFAVIMPTLEVLGPEILRRAGASVVSGGEGSF